MTDIQDRINDLNSDWIKYVVGSDGRTVRESEMALHAELALKVVRKHLPGRHDQQSHAPKARAGNTEYATLSHEEYDKISDEAYNGYTDEQRMAIDSYRLSPTVNKLLRGDASSDTPVSLKYIGSSKPGFVKMESAGKVTLKEFAERLDACAKATPLADNLVLHRIGELPLADEFTDNGFVSTAADADTFFNDVAPMIASWNRSPAVYNIRAKKGTPAIFAGPSLETEIILGRGLRYKIIDSSEIKVGDRWLPAFDVEVY